MFPAGQGAGLYLTGGFSTFPRAWFLFPSFAFDLGFHFGLAFRGLGRGLYVFFVWRWAFFPGLPHFFLTTAPPHLTFFFFFPELYPLLTPRETGLFKGKDQATQVYSPPPLYDGFPWFSLPILCNAHIHFRRRPKLPPKHSKL